MPIPNIAFSFLMIHYYNNDMAIKMPPLNSTALGGLRVSPDAAVALAGLSGSFRKQMPGEESNI